MANITCDLIKFPVNVIKNESKMADSQDIQIKLCFIQPPSLRSVVSKEVFVCVSMLIHVKE